MSKNKTEETILKDRARAKKWRKDNPERFRKSTKAWYLKNKELVCEIEKDRSRLKLYGITKEEFNKMLEEHLNKCAICGIDMNNLKKSLCIDHDHDTGEIRGLLCVRCNSSQIGRASCRERV